MSLMVQNWDQAQTKKEISKRFRNAQEDRLPLEHRWIRNEQVLYGTTGRPFGDANSPYDIDMPAEGAEPDVNMAYTFKNFRFIHAQMSANPPSVAMRPTSSDQEDHRKADAADRVVRWALRKYLMQEKTDQRSLHTLTYGTGFTKRIWDSGRGDILEFNEKTGELRLEGDIVISVPSPWNMYLDPDAKSWDECKWLFERIYIDYEEACARWPQQQDLLKKALVTRTSGPQSPNESRGQQSSLEEQHYNSVELLEYWETGLPTNGYMGRYCITLTDGTPIEPCRPNPYRFKRAGAISLIEGSDLPDQVKEAKIARLPEQAQLPYSILTDIDVPNRIWGKATVEYSAQLQDNLNQLDSAQLDNARSHGNARMVVNDNTEVTEDSISDSPLDIIRISENIPPFFVKPPEMMPDMTASRAQHRQGIDDVWGVNESMFGNQSREQSGASMQYATNQGNMIRRRLFNKYVLAVESDYKGILNLVRKHWSVDRTINVIGKEKALEAIDLKGADIDGGYDCIGEYGVTLSLDPITRREEIMSMQPMFEKAGIPMRSTMKMMKLNELEPMYDELDLADSRQKEIFDRMIGTGRYIQPKPFRDHVNMIGFAMKYFMTQEFESLPEEAQQLCEQHIQERAQLAAQESSGGAAPAANQPPASPGPVPAPGSAGPVPPPSAAPQPAQAQ